MPIGERRLQLGLWGKESVEGLTIANRTSPIGNWQLAIDNPNSVIALQDGVLHVNHRMGFSARHAPQQQGLIVHLR